ncbi:Cytochrome [Forsythia ovata]|uniref:Cytochrome n=1 Tax=Forsythia ovata TaxID=205694 RepID=A0ABD1RJX4_9LAMI
MEIPIIWCICIIFAVTIHSFIKKLGNSKQNIHFPPGPVALPVIGHLHLLGSTMHISFKNLASKYGPIMLIRTGATTSYVVSNGAIAQEVFKTHDIKFAARPEFGGSDYQIYKDNLFSTLDYGKQWAFLKKICMTEILSNQQINRFADIRKEEMMSLLRVIAKHSQNGEGCDVGVEFMALTNNVISMMTMTAQIREIARGITQLSGLLSLGEAFTLLKKYDLFGAGRKVKALLLPFDALMDGIISKHEMEIRDGKRERKDMMDILLRISEDKTSEVKLTKADIKGLFLDLFLGSTEETSVALQWALAELLNHPNALKKLQDEIDTTVGKCREDCSIKGFPIAKNSSIAVNLYAINRDPNAWEDAAEFKPERFLINAINAIGHADQEDMKGQNFSYVPFGGGRRGCPGANLAISVLHITLAALIQCFHWKIKGAEKVDMEEGAGLSVPMAHPLVCYPILRVNPSDLLMIN